RLCGARNGDRFDSSRSNLDRLREGGAVYRILDLDLRILLRGELEFQFRPYRVPQKSHDVLRSGVLDRRTMLRVYERSQCENETCRHAAMSVHRAFACVSLSRIEKRS